MSKEIRVTNLGTLYRIAPLPRQEGYVHLLVAESDGYASLHKWFWDEVKAPRDNIIRASDTDVLNAMQSLWEWLVEQDLVTLQAIGPEDSEYFATPKLKELGNES